METHIRILHSKIHSSEYYTLTISALIQNELYVIKRVMKKNAEDKILQIMSRVYSDVVSAVNCK